MELVKLNTTGRIVDVFMRDSTTGAGKTGLVAGDMSGEFIDSNGAATALSFAPGALGDPYSVGKWAAVGNGAYKYHAPDGMFDQLGRCDALFRAAGSIDKKLEFQVVAFDPNDVDALGLSRLDQTISAAKTLTAAYDAAKTAAQAGDAMTLSAGAIVAATFGADAISSAALSNAAVAKIEAALLNEGDGQALIDAIVQAIDAADIDTDILPSLIGSWMLNRVLSGNHDTPGTPGAFLQQLDAAVSSRSAFDPATDTTKANLEQINGTAIPGTGAQVAGAFEFFFDVATPNKTVNDVGVSGSGLTQQDVRDAMALATGETPVAGSIDTQLASKSTHSPADVWSSATRTLTGLGFVMSAGDFGASSLNGKGDWNTTTPPAATAVASQVRTELTAELARLDATVSSRMPTTHIAATMGKVDGVGTVDVCTTNSDMRGTDGANTIAPDNALIAAIAGYVDTEVGAIKAKTDNLPASPANEVTLATIDSIVDAIKVVTDKLSQMLQDDAGTPQYTANALEQAPAGGGGGSGDATQAKQDEILTAISGLNEFDITRVGPGWNVETLTITLTQGDDYSATKNRAIVFDLSGIGFSLVGATARFRATRQYLDPIEGTATILDPAGTPQLQLEWTREQLSGEPGEYYWDAEIVDSEGDVATTFAGKLILNPSRTALGG